ncbi:MAG: hypothetical protein DWQ07_05575 [Chloroflexi bacterium]|nr:MAG: hypothetical protein DWQ07_05575 [Chloroflexota bacterium]MBL1194901.1 hypothetical protein [Chloroflexota bacterium]NOH12192.1 hypothetical protein [Chloroflexota bacterium]
MKAGFEDKHSLTTDVILVVKGAGEQKLDATLGSFLDGFLKAVRGYDPDAVINIGPESKIFKDYDYTPAFKDEEWEQTAVEVLLEYKEEDEDTNKDGEKSDDAEGRFRRIWIKEAYWEPRLGLPGAFRSLFHEWRLTSYALVKLLEKIFFPWQDDLVKNDDGLGYTRSYHPRNNSKHSTWAYFFYYLLAYAVILLFLSFTGVWGNPLIQSALEIPRSAGNLPPFLASPISHVTALAGLAIWASLASALRARRNRKIEESGKPLPRMPGLGNWLLIGLVVALFLEPLAYIAWLSVYAVVFVISNLLARRIAWNQRPDFYTDAPLHYQPDEDEKRLYRRNNRISLISQLLYRMLVTIALPIAVTLLGLAKIFLILNIFGDLGTRINTTLSNIITQTFGDVTAYAVDPAAASKVQNVVEEEMRTFGDLTRKGQDEAFVNNIHIFAHSQGTPITFEVLFHKLPKRLFKKINTYITIGSVLNLHHLVNEVLDDNFWSRFPPAEYPEPQGRFKWFNFWNFTDPITQFTGLEAYRQDVLWIGEDGTSIRKYYDGTARVDYSKASPFSIKTRDSLLKNHSEYWGNADEIHTPFIERIFYPPGTRWIPDAWASEEIKFKHEHRKLGGYHMNVMNVEEIENPEAAPEQREFSRRSRNHFLWLSASWLLLASLASALFYFAGSRLAFWVNGGRQGLLGMANSTGTWLGRLLPMNATEALSDLWGSISNFYLDQEIINGIGLAVLTWAVLSGLFQIIPVSKIIGFIFPQKKIQFFDPDKAKTILEERRKDS